MKRNICAIIVHSPLHDPFFIGTLEKKLLRSVSPENYVGRTDGSKLTYNKECNGYILIVGTGGTESTLLKLIDSLKEKPVIVVAHDVANSLPAFIEVYPLLKEIHKKITYMYSSFDALEEAIEKANNLLNVSMRISQSRLGLIGGISEWLVYSKSHPTIIKERLGIDVIEVPIDEISDSYFKEALDEKDTNEINELISKSHSQVSRQEIVKAYRLYKAIGKIVSKRSLDGFTIKCFDIIKTLDTTACLALSLFNSSGITAGCEGDLPSLLSMHILSVLTGKPVFMGNPSIISEKSFMIAHCTAPISMSREKPMIRTHFESNRGVGIAITFDEVDVTFLKLSPKLERARLFSGKIVRGEPSSDRHCRSQAWVEVSFDPKKLLMNSYGNHYVFVEGNYIEELSKLMELFSIEPEVL